MFTKHDGIAMGSPLCPTLTSIFMGFLESKTTSKVQDRINYFRYVDDCIVIAKNKQELNNFYKLINEHDSTKLIEKEQNNELPYLDVLVKRKNTELVTTVYKKETFTGNSLNFQSHCNLNGKINLLRTLRHRAHLICSPEFFEEEIDLVGWISCWS